jgi:inner membrane protein
MVGAATAKVFGLNYVLTTLGAILPDLVEMLSKKMSHRGISHSVVISLVALVLLWSTPLRDAWIGVVFGHLVMDSLTMMGVPLLDERSRRITIFGGKLRTGSPGEFVVSGIIAFVAFVILGSFSVEAERRN